MANQIELFHDDRLKGSSQAIFEAVTDLTDYNHFNNETSSLVVVAGNWELFGGENFTNSAHTPAPVTVTPTGGRGGTGIYYTTDLALAGLANDDLSSLKPK